LIAQISPLTPYYQVAILLFILGLSLGMIIQIPSLVSQNLVAKKDIGVATSTVTFARSIGAAFGTALFGTILNTRLSYHISTLLPIGKTSQKLDSFSSIANLPEPQKQLMLKAFTLSIDDIFLAAVPFAIILFLVSLTLPRKNLLLENNSANTSDHK
jgi:hypothetical protein